MNPYYATICDSSGENAFPSQPVCSCPFSRDNHSKVRAWGNPYGWHYYNEETKRIEMRKNNLDVIQRPAWYSERKNIAVDPMNTASVLPCHDPCRHNKCSTLSKWVFNPGISCYVIIKSNKVLVAKKSMDCLANGPNTKPIMSKLF